MMNEKYEKYGNKNNDYIFMKHREIGYTTEGFILDNISKIMRSVYMK